MGLRGSSLARSRGAWAMQEELHGGVTENVGGEMSKPDSGRQAAIPWNCLLNIWLNCAMKEFNIHDWSMSQTTGIKSLMCSAELSRGTVFIWKPPFGICYVKGKFQFHIFLCDQQNSFTIKYCLEASSLWGQGHETATRVLFIKFNCD